MSVLKIKKNGVWESVSGTSGHTHTVSDITDFPEDFTTSGGDADTVDGKHASDFAIADHTHEQINVLTGLVGDTDVSTQIADAIVSKADSDHGHEVVTETVSGFMSPNDKKKLDSIDEGANKIVVDSVLDAESTNPVQNKAITEYINTKNGSLVNATTEQLDKKVDKVDGKALSTNDYTTEEKTKLAGVEEGANKIIVDSALSDTSTNPVENKAVYTAINELSSRVGDSDVSEQIETAVVNKADVDHTHTLSSFGIAASATELNKLDGVTATTTELNYIDGVTSNIQDQLNNKADAGHTHTIDSAFSSTSTNPVQNKVIYNTILNLESDIVNCAAAEHAHSTDHIDGLMPFVRTNGEESNTASAIYSSAEGYGTTASNIYAHAGGNQSIASGDCSFSHGYKCEAAGAVSVAFGERTIANGYQLVCGQMNVSANGVPVGSQSEDYVPFMVGNGTSTTRSTGFQVTAAGSCRNLTGNYSNYADFAEYFEWSDGNADAADRRGLFVTLDGDKIRVANKEDDYILGIVSGTAAFIGNSASISWDNKYLKDVFGAPMTQEVEISESVNEVTGETIPAYIVEQFVINPDYDPEQKYVGRQFRHEWAPVGMLGQVVAIDDGTCVVGGYCAPSVNGIGTASESGYRVMKRIDDTHIKVLVR